MRKLMLILSIVLLCFGGCMPASQQEVLNLTNAVSQIVPAVREAVSTSSEDTKDKIEIVLGQVEKVNEAVATAETPLEEVKAGWKASEPFNPYYPIGALVLTIIGEGVALLKNNKSKKDTEEEKAALEKGINRVKGEAEPDLAKKIHDTIKIYTG